MKPALTWVLRSTCLALLLVYSLPVTSAATEPLATIGTGSIEGVYYSAGAAVAKMFNLKRQEFGGWIANKSTEGSLENIEQVLSGDIDFGIAQANFLFFAWNGEGIFEGQPKKNLRAVLGLYTEDLTLIAAEDAGIITPADLVGKRVNVGAPGSSDEITTKNVLEKLGIDPAKVHISEYPTYQASEMIQTNDIDAYFYTVGHPNLSIMEATEGKRKVHIIPFDQEFIDEVAALRPYFSAVNIDTQYYGRLDVTGKIPTIGIQSVLFTRADMNEETVYRVVKQVMENLDLFRQQHPAFARLNSKQMAQDIIIPLHPGAESYFREAGILY
jgi:uncharacterized protein